MDMTALIAEAADLANDRLSIKLEHDDFAGPGERSYSEEDVERIKHQMNAFEQLHALLSGKQKHRAFVISDDAYSVLCGLVQNAETLEHRGLDSEMIQSCEDNTWDALREMFPFDDYKGHDEQ